MQTKFAANELTCICSHSKADHVHKMGVGPTFCSSNQKLCDCWQYTIRKEVKRSNLVFEQAALGYSMERGKYDEVFVEAVRNLNTIKY